MEITTVCRVCLSDESKVQQVVSPVMHRVYEKLTDKKLNIDDGRPTKLCNMCYALLQKCCEFMYAAKHSEAILMQLYLGGFVFSQDLWSMIERPRVHSYSVTPIECVNLYDGASGSEDNLKSSIKKEIYETVIEDLAEDEIKETAEEIKQDPDSDHASRADHAPTDFGTDSEDDLPLKSLKTEKVVRQKRKYKKRSKLDASEVTLSKEQQLQDVLSRATSLNYLTSPFRCALCYRGFASRAAYRNHGERHDERSGPHSCDVCHMRYRSARLLRTHAHAAHSRHYRCNKCGHSSHTAHQASDHERWHNGHTYECQLCGQNFIKRTSYLTHMRKRHPTDHICDACGERFVGRHGLLMHKSKSHRRDEVEDSSSRAERFCAECNIQFVTLDAWKRHILTSIKHTLHTQQTKQCPICSIDVDGALPEHMRAHEKALRPRPAPPPPPAARLPCDQCGQVFVNRAKLGAHVRRVHLGLKYNKNIVCELCGKKCTSNASLKYHQRTHTGERPHACAAPACGKRFADANQLRIHARTHSGERPYRCERCGKRFAQKPALNRHYRVHTGAKPYVCDLCSKSFSQSNSLKVHVRAVHLKMPTYRRKGQTAPEGAAKGTVDAVNVQGEAMKID